MPRLMAEYPGSSQLLQAAQAMRDLGYRELEAYSPYPVPGLDAVLRRRPSRLPWLVFAIGIAAAAATYALEWLLNGYLYPLNVGNRPPHYPLSYVPIVFEMGVLFAALCAFSLVLVLARLPTLAHPVFATPGFESATHDRFWLEVSSHDPRFSADEAERALSDTAALRVVLVEDQP